MLQRGDLLYAQVTALGGVAPSLLLPVLVDLGTRNEALLGSAFYAGTRRRRAAPASADADADDDVMHELLGELEARFGAHTLLLFEALPFATSRRLLSQYRRASARSGRRTLPTPSPAPIPPFLLSPNSAQPPCGEQHEPHRALADAEPERDGASGKASASCACEIHMQSHAGAPIT